MTDNERIESRSHEYQEYYLERMVAIGKMILFYQRLSAVILVLFWIFWCWKE